MRARAAVNGYQKPRQSEKMVDHNALGSGGGIVRQEQVWTASTPERRIDSG